MRKETQCVHSGTIKDTMSGGVNSPIFTSSAFEYLDRELVAYPRYMNYPPLNC
jgi:O-acetylhomoserine/O-acetylserine sulfhydrylase-like pyridoxal-dependent enzyme